MAAVIVESDEIVIPPPENASRPELGGYLWPEGEYVIMHPRMNHFAYIMMKSLQEITSDDKLAEVIHAMRYNSGYPKQFVDMCVRALDRMQGWTPTKVRLAHLACGCFLNDRRCTCNFQPFWQIVIVFGPVQGRISSLHPTFEAIRSVPESWGQHVTHLSGSYYYPRGDHFSDASTTDSE